MSIATLPTRASESTQQDNALTCESCSSSMTIGRNPYFGTGLAIHRFIATCNGCHGIAFVPEPTPVAETGLIARVIGLFRSVPADSARV